MSFILPLIGGLLGGTAGFLGGGKQQQVNSSYNNTSNTNQSQATQQNTNSTGSTTPNLSPIQQQMIQQIQAGTANNVNNSTNLGGYTQAGLENINQGSQAAQQAMSANIASRGLSFSPAASTSQNMNTMGRIAQGNQFLSSIPLLQTQLNQTALQQEMQGFQIQPTGSTSTGSSSGTGETTGSSTTANSGTGVNMQYGNPAAGAVAGAGAGLFGGASLSQLYPSLFGGSGSGSSGNSPMGEGGSGGSGG